MSCFQPSLPWVVVSLLTEFMAGHSKSKENLHCLGNSLCHGLAAVKSSRHSQKGTGQETSVKCVCHKIKLCQGIRC